MLYHLIQSQSRRNIMLMWPHQTVSLWKHPAHKVYQCNILMPWSLSWLAVGSFCEASPCETKVILWGWSKKGNNSRVGKLKQNMLVSLFLTSGHNPKQSKPHFRTKEAAAFLLKLISARTPSYRCCCCHHFLLSLHIMVVNMKAGTELTLWICIAIYRYVMSEDYLMIPSFSSKSLPTTKFSWSVQPINQATSELKQDSLKHLETKRAAVVWACGNCNLASHVG